MINHQNDHDIDFPAGMSEPSLLAILQSAALMVPALLTIFLMSYITVI